MKKTLSKGKESFLNYYFEKFPFFENIEGLQSFLRLKSDPVLLISPKFYKKVHKMWGEKRLSWSPLPWFKYALKWPVEVPFGTKLPGFSDGHIYSLNPASLMPVIALGVQPGDAVLDACAAPGGKSLALLSSVNGRVELIANDQSPNRYHRLRSSLKQYGYGSVKTLNLPAQTLGNMKKKYDKILIDAPCSSEKHVFANKKHLKIWSEDRVRKLSNLQFGLVQALFPLLKPGGRMVYSTCALTPEENEAVIAKVLNKVNSVKLVHVELPVGGEDGMSGGGLSEEQCKMVRRVNFVDGMDVMFVAGLERVR